MRHRCCSMRRGSPGPWSTTPSMPIRTRRTTPSSACAPRPSNSARRAGRGSPSSPSRCSLLLAAMIQTRGPRALRLGGAGRGGGSSRLADLRRRFRRSRRLPRQVPRQSLARLDPFHRHHPGTGSGRPARGVSDPAVFIRAETALAAPPLVPEIQLYLASEILPIWHATEADLERNGLPPPYWAFAWPGGQALTRHLLDHPRSRRRPAGAGFRRRQRAHGHRRRHGRAQPPSARRRSIPSPASPSPSMPRPMAWRSR